MKNRLIGVGEKYCRWIMLVIIGLQAALLVGTLIKLGGAREAVDTSSYVIPAKNLLRTGILMNQDGSPILFRTPGYCVFLALVYLITDESDLAVILIQFLMVLATNYMIYYAVSRISRKKIVGCVASFFYICDAAVYYHAVCILTDTVMPFLLMMAFVFFYNYYKKHKIIWFFWSAVILNCAMMVRPQSMYYNVILVLVCLILAFLRKLGWRECVIYITIFALAYGGWSLRNYKWFGEAMFSSVRIESYYTFYAPLVYSEEEGSYDEGQVYFRELLYEKYQDYDNLSQIEKLYAKEDIGKSYINSHAITYLKINIIGLINEMRDPCSACIRIWNLPLFIFVLLWCFITGMLILSYCIYAVSFLKTINRQTWFDWLILLTVMYLMASTAVLGYSRFRLAFYPLCLVGTFTCYKKSRKGLVMECMSGNADLKGVICDFDGTLYRQKPVRFSMFFALIGHYVTHIGKLRQLYGIYLFRKIREHKDFKRTPYTRQIEYVSERVKIGKDELDNVIQYWMFEYPLPLIGKYADKYLISALTDVQGRGVKVIIYSDYPVDDKLEVLGIKPDYVFYPGHCGINSLKPSKEAMDLIVSEVGIATSELIYIGDRQKKDGVSAQLVGIRFVLV